MRLSAPQTILFLGKKTNEIFSHQKLIKYAEACVEEISWTNKGVNRHMKEDIKVFVNEK